MNKTELILRIAEETGFSRKNVELGLNAAINLITKALTEEEKVQIVGFGAFETKVRAERMGRNPKTGEDIPTLEPCSRAGFLALAGKETGWVPGLTGTHPLKIKVLCRGARHSPCPWAR